MGQATDFREFRIAVITRGNVNDFSCQAKAWAIWEQLHRTASSSLSAGYFSLVVMETQPTYLGFDAQRHPRWILTARLWYKG